MLHPSTKRLIDRLCEMTLQRKIEWISGEHPDALVYDTEGYRVLLEGNPPALVLCDALGQELERASQEDLASTNHIDGGTYEAVIATMREDASRIARGTESAIETVLGGLEKANDAAEALAEKEAEAETEVEAEVDADQETVASASETDPAQEDDQTATDLPTDTPDDAVTTDLEAAAEDATETEIADASTPLVAETVVDLVAEAEVSDLHAEAFEDAETGNILPEIETASSDLDDATGSLEDSTEAFEDTPDVGEAVAALADQVNQAEQAGISADRDVSTSIISGAAFSSVVARPAAQPEAVEDNTVTEAAEAEEAPAEASEAFEETQEAAAEEIAAAEQSAPEEDAIAAAVQPGEVISLSAIADTGSEDGLIHGESQVVENLPPSFEAPVEEAAADAESQPDWPETNAEETAEASEQSEEATAPNNSAKRFNPWI